MFRKNCLICKSDNFSKIIDLGMHPFADTFITYNNLSKPDIVYPLECSLCKNCGHVQTICETDPSLRYSKIDYSYTSSNSNFSKNHWEEFAKEVLKNLKMKKNSFIVEIGSNDGYLSKQFSNEGHRIIGVDPSPYMVKLAADKNIQTIMGLFNNSMANKIFENFGKANLIIANNVFNHSDNPLEFIKSVSKIMAPEGHFIFEQPYWLIGLKSGKFDQIYHEHVSYFTVKSLSSLLDKANLIIKEVKIVDYHGGSLRITAQKKEDLISESKNVRKMIKNEEMAGTFKLKTYLEFMKKNNLIKNKFLQKIYKIKDEGHTIIAVGAAAKGNTFLNFYNLDGNLIDYVTDSSPHKKGKFTPATRIPIVGDEIFLNYGKVYALILSWNIANKLKPILLKINQNIEFIVPG